MVPILLLALLTAASVWMISGQIAAYLLNVEMERRVASLRGCERVWVGVCTPGLKTGDGCGIALALNEGKRAVWTAPIKALVAEKFFDLVDLLGAQQVGLATNGRIHDELLAVLRG